MIEVTFLCPAVHDDTRKAHGGEVWDSLEAKLLRGYGGFTKGALCQGSWRDPDGATVLDTSWPYTVALPHGAGLLESASLIRETVSMLTRVLGQRCIYVRYLGQGEIL